MGCCQCMRSERETLMTIETQKDMEQARSLIGDIDSNGHRYNSGSVYPADNNPEKISDSTSDIQVITLKLPEIVSEFSISSWKEEDLSQYSKVIKT